MSSKQSRRSTSSAPQPTRVRRVNENGEPDGAQPSETILFLPLDWILPAQYQPRQYFDEEAMQQLTASVKERGILMPLLVRQKGEQQYQLVAGERRYKAARAVGLTAVPVVVRQLTDFEALSVALLENIQRDDLNAIEETEGILHLLALNLGCSVELVPQLLYRLKHQASSSRLAETQFNTLHQLFSL